MRRRLWWYMCAIDSRAAEDHGIALSDPNESADTCFPLNVNDSELTPHMTGLPVEQARWTEMTFPIAMLKASRVMQRINRQPDASLTVATSEPSGDQIVEDIMTLKEIYPKFCDANIPIQNATLLFSCMIVAKLEFLGSQPWAKRWDEEKQVPSANEEALLSACEILEMNLQLATADLLRSFRWCFETYTQYHLLTYLLWHLCVKPTGPNVGRAWKAIDDSFEAAKHREFSCDPGSKWIVLQRLKDKALRIRQPHDNAESYAANPSTNLGESVGMGTAMDGFGDGPDLMLDDNDDWDFNAAGLDMHNFEGIDFSMSFP